MPSMDLTPEEARHIRRRRQSETRDFYFDLGLKAAAREVLLWDSIGSEIDRRSLADGIMQLKRPRKKGKLR